MEKKATSEVPTKKKGHLGCGTACEGRSFAKRPDLAWWPPGECRPLSKHLVYSFIKKKQGRRMPTAPRKSGPALSVSCFSK
jgi:hypothetical protein